MEVRTATMDDILDLARMCKDMVDQSLFAHVGFDGRHFGEYCMRLVVLDEGEIFVTEEDGEITGAILCSIGPCVTAPTLVGYEHGFYIRPERRSLRAARLLLAAYVDWAKAKGAQRINAGNSAGAPDEGYQKLLKRSGFEKAGSLMYQNV